MAFCAQEVEAPWHRRRSPTSANRLIPPTLMLPIQGLLRKNHHEAIMQRQNTFESHISLIGGRISAPRCQALSKRSKLQCRKAALAGKRVCMFHGGKSSGPVTEDGRKRCAIAKTVHGYETRAAREYRAEKFRELQILFDTMYSG